MVLKEYFQTENKNVSSSFNVHSFLYCRCHLPSLSMYGLLYLQHQVKSISRYLDALTAVCQALENNVINST